MTAITTTPVSTALATTSPVFTGPKRLALAGFLGGYTGLTHQAYALDLRQFAAWCRRHDIRLFRARRADIECFARDLEARGRARATVTRRLCTIAGIRTDGQGRNAPSLSGNHTGSQRWQMLGRAGRR
jgi:hypothetical protein